MFKQKRNQLLLVIPDGFRVSVKPPTPLPIKNIDEIFIQDVASFTTDLGKSLIKDEDTTVTVIHLDISSVEKSNPEKHPAEFEDYWQLYQYYMNIRAEVNRKARFGYDYALVTIRTTHPPNCETIFYKKLVDGRFMKCSQQEAGKPTEIV